MESLTKLSFKQHPTLPLSLPHPHHRTSFSTSAVSFRTNPPNRYPKIRSSSSKSPRSNNPLSLLKTPLCIAVAATALFFSRLGYRTPIAFAAPPPVVETTTVTAEEAAVSDEEREKSLEEKLNSNPNDVDSLKSLMEIKIKNRKLPEAVDVINRLIELEPEEFELPLLRAHMYSYMGESELAKVGFEEILEKDPLRVEAYHGLVMAVSQGETSSKVLDQVTNRIQEALDKCKQEKKKDEIRDFKLLIAQVRVIEGNYNEALKIYQELVKEEPRDFRPYLCQGIIYTLLKKKDEAATQFDKYKRLVPKGHPYAQYFDDNMLATKVFSQMGENERTKVGSVN